MPNIAKGSKSGLLWKQESALNTKPTGNWNQLPYNSESLAENINPIQSEDMRIDRRNTAIRGGNISSGGGIVHDFGLMRELPLFRHLLASGAAAAGSAVTVPALAASTAYSRGDFVKNTGNDIYVCVIGGTTDASVTSGDLTVTAGRQVVLGASSTELVFEFAAPAATAIYEHTFTGGTDFLATGLAFEKQVKGGDADLFIVHTGCRINSLDLRIEQEAIAKATWNILSRTSTKYGTTQGGTPNFLAQNPVTGYNALVSLANDNGSVQRLVKSANLQITNNIDEQVYCLNRRSRSDLPEGTRRATGNVSFYFQDTAEYDYFKNESTLSMKLSFVYGGAWLEIHLPEVKLFGAGSPQVSGAGPVMGGLDFTAFNLNGAYDIRVKARNTEQNLPI